MQAVIIDAQISRSLQHNNQIRITKEINICRVGEFETRSCMWDILYPPAQCPNLSLQLYHPALSWGCDDNCMQQVKHILREGVNGMCILQTKLNCFFLHLF